MSPPSRVNFDPAEFEAFCLKVVRHLHPADAIHFHLRGELSHADQGIDIEGESDGRRIGVQCKVGKVGKAVIVKALEALKRYPHRLDHLLIMCAARPTPAARDEFRQRSATASTHAAIVAKVELWGPDELEQRLGPLSHFTATHSHVAALLRDHGTFLKRYFQEELVWKEAGLTLKAIYIDLDCGVRTWGQIVASKSEDERFRIDLFREKSAERRDLLEAVMEWVVKPRPNDFIVIQGTAGAGKSTFTYRLASELLERGYRPIRIRLRDIDLSADPVSEIFAKIPTNYPEARFVPRRSDLALTFTERNVLILDGWDELTLGTEQRFRDRVSAFFNAIRHSVITPYGEDVRVIITGRPSDAVTNSANLQSTTPILTIQPLTPDQLREYFRKLDAAYRSEGKDPDVRQVIDDYKHEWDLGPPPVGSTPHRSIDVIGWPLLAHVAYRLLRDCEPEQFRDLLQDRASLLRCLSEYCYQHSRFPSDRPGGEELRTRLQPSDLRKLVQETAIAITHSGSECISKATLQREMQSRADSAEVEQRLQVAETFDLFVVNYLFKTRYDQLGCEFVHKSLREFAYAEALVDTMKRLAKVPSDHRARLRVEVDHRAMISSLLHRQWLSREVRQLLESQFAWEIHREAGRHDDPIAFRRQEAPLPLDAWIVIRDRLARLWGDWNLYLLGGSAAEGHLDRSAADARLGDALFRICATVHGTVARRLLDNLGVLDPRACFWADQGATVPDEPMHQMALFKCPDKRLRFFAPNHTGEPADEAPLRAALARINALRPKFDEELLDRVDLGCLVLIGAPIQRLSFRFCDLTYSNLYESNLTGADLEGADISNAFLEKTELVRANLNAAELDYSSLAKADLRGATLKNASLTKTNLCGARGITVEQILEAENWEEAVFDTEFRRALEIEARRRGASE